MQFQVSPQEQERVQQWLQGTVYPQLVRQQKRATRRPTAAHTACWQAGVPYGGSVGGGLTYKFTPTSLGVVTEVEHTGYPDALNLTDYDSW